MLMIENFNEFLKEKTQKQGKFYYSYLGIKRKEYPKWNGWVYIEKLRSQQIPIDEVQDPYLDTLVYNFYFLMFLTAFLSK